MSPASQPVHARRFLPLELVFNPHWWHRTAGISFDEPFYLDIETRQQADIVMRRMLHQRFGELGLGEAEPQPRPIIGSQHVAGGFVIPALLGAKIRFSADAAPQPYPLHLTPQQVEDFAIPDFHSAWPMKQLIAQMDALEAEHNHRSNGRQGQPRLVGDLNTDGLLNAAYHLYGQELFSDMFLQPQRAARLLELIANLIIEVATYVRQRTGSCSISVNRMVAQVDECIFLHANCSVPMISPHIYRQLHLPVEKRMAEALAPFGIHHCGGNLEKYAAAYAELNPAFVDVGWGSDVAACRQLLPNAFFNLRLSPVRMLTCTPQEIAADTERLLLAAGPLEQAGVCCINMDYGTPDDNIFAMSEVVEKYRKYGA